MKTQTLSGATIAACAIFCILGFAQYVSADPHYVDLNSTNPVSPFLSWNTASTNIQDAVDVATNGATVLVTNGTYYVSAEITVASGITIQSVNGWTNTIVDAQESGRCFYLDDAGAILDGFTITRGYASGSGGGVYCNGGTVRNCCISSNTATGGSYSDSRGGGIYCNGGTVHDCTISDNLAQGIYYAGGGVYLASGGTLQDCIIANNEVFGGTSGSSGSPIKAGGVYCTGSTITNCTISGNTARGANSGQSASGGGVYMSGNAVVASCIVMANEALRSSGGAGQTGDGGGITCAGGVVRDCLIQGNLASSGSGGGVSGGDVVHCRITGNFAGDMGGGIYLSSSAKTVQNCLIDGNIALSGGGISLGNGTIESCTVVDNLAVLDGGGLNAVGGQVRNTIIYYNDGSFGRNHRIDTDFSNITHTCTFPLLAGTGNFAAEPDFIDPISGDYKLLPGSLCVNAGTNQAWMTSAVDLQGSNRLQYATVDLGAYELQTNSLLCNPVANVREGFVPLSVTFTGVVNNIEPTGLMYEWDFNNDGTVDQQGIGLSSPTYLYATSGTYAVSLAVSNATCGRVATVKDAYIKVGPPMLYVSGSGSHTFPFDSWADAATNVLDAVAAAPEGAAVRITNGTYELSAPMVLGKPIQVLGVNGYSNVTLLAVNTNRLCYLEHPEATIQGLTLSNGYAVVGGGIGAYRGGIVRDCRITSCEAQWDGGGVYSEGGVIFTNSIIEDNKSGHYAGGVWCAGNDLYVDSCVRGNRSGQGVGLFGGGVYCWQGATFRRCEISDNDSGYGGDGICTAHGTLVEDCTISGNHGSGAFASGVMCFYGGTVRNCDINCNTGFWTGGVSMYGGGLVENCRIHKNKGGTTEVGAGCGGVSFDNDGPSIVRSCAIYGNTSVSGGGINFRKGGSVENCSIFDNAASFVGGGIYVRNLSPGDAAIKNSIVYFNQSPRCANWYFDGQTNDAVFESVCTTPVVGGMGNFDNLPEFRNWSTGDCSLLPGSPCIDTGTNEAWMAAATDLLRNPRLAGPTVDIGACEMTPGELACNLICEDTEHISPYDAVLYAFAEGTNSVPLYYMWDLDGDGSTDLEGWGLSVVTNLYGDLGNYTISLTVSNASGETASISRTDYLRIGPEYVYVALSAAHTSPYTNWVQAATNIQDALDVAVFGSTVLLSNGTFAVTSPVVVSNGVVLRGLNGYAQTIVDAGSGSRCIDLMNRNAVIQGLTITGGRTGGGGGDNGGGVYFYGGGTVSDCLICSNEAAGYYGDGGGAYFFAGGTLDRCIVRDNTAEGEGGGIAMYKGGEIRSSLVCDNYSDGYWNGGGGVHIEDAGTLDSCTVVTNRAAENGGGVYADSGGSIYNSIIYNNTADDGGDNLVGSAHVWNSCTLPAVSSSYDEGGNTTNDPSFLDLPSRDFRLRAGSPCVDAGTNQSWMATAEDLAGLNRIIGPYVDMGAHEFGGLRCYITGNPRQGLNPLSVEFAALVGGTNMSGMSYEWDFQNDGTNDLTGDSFPSPTNTYPSPGLFSVSLVVSNTAGEIANVTNIDYVYVAPCTAYVARAASHAFPFASWETAASNIQAAVDAGLDGTVVLVTNDTYSLAEEILITNGITIRGVAGAALPVLDGGDAVRCLRLSHSNAVAEWLTITAGRASDGGGAYLDYGGTIRHCLVTNNTATDDGGGIYCYYGGTVEETRIAGNNASDVGGGLYFDRGGQGRNLLIYENYAGDDGGGAGCYYGGQLMNSTISENEANWDGGGVYCTSGGTILDSIIYFNTGWLSSRDNLYGSGYTATYSCVTPSIAGEGNISLDPMFADRQAADYHLKSTAGTWSNAVWVLHETNSPCIDTGDPSSSYANEPPWDGGFVNMGAYGNTVEASKSTDTDTDGLSDTFELYRFGSSPTDQDTDDDTSGDGDEWIADTDPQDTQSVLAIVDIAASSTGVVQVTWKGGEWATQYVECRHSLTSTGDQWTALYTNLPPTPISNTFEHASGMISNAFYRLKASR